MTGPNFLLISADQQRGDCIGVEGRRIRTPHLDALAGQGTRFSCAITPCVICQPARASILTGVLPRTHGVHDNGIDLDPNRGESGFAGILAATDYDTAFFGKAHFSTYHTFQPTGTPECIESSASFNDWHGPYMGFNHLEIMLAAGQNWFPEPPKGHHYERWFHADGQGKERTEAYWRNAGDTKGAAQTWHSELPVAWHNSTWTADRAINWLRRERGRPFCAWVSFPDPHHPFDCPLPWSRLHSPSSVDLPRFRERNFEGRPWWHEQVLTSEPHGSAESVEMRKNYSRIGPQSDDQLREIIANTFGQIALIDHHVGRLMIALQETGLADNTVVIYFSDHGDWLGDHGLVLKGPMHYDGLLRVPLIMRGPGIPAGKVANAPVSTIDLAPTLLDYSGLHVPETFHGTSLRPVAENNAGRDHALNEWELLPGRAGVALSLRTVRTRTHRMTMDMTTGTGELYDLAVDPCETRNIFDEPSVVAVRGSLERVILERPDDMLPVGKPVGIA